MREQQVADVAESDAALGEPGLERRPRRRRAAVEERKAVVSFDEVDTNRAFASPEQEVDRLQRIHNPIFSVEPYVRRMRWLIPVLAALVLVPAAPAQLTPEPSLVATRVIGIHYRAHDGRLRPAWLLVPVGYDGKRPLPLVISPHGRGVGAAANMRIWGDLPGEGGFAVINPSGEGDGCISTRGATAGRSTTWRACLESSRHTGSGSTGRGSMRSGLDGWPGDVAPRRAPPAPARGCGCVRPCDRHAPALRRLRPHEGRRRCCRRWREPRSAARRRRCLRPTPLAALTRSRRALRGPTSRSSSTGARRTGSSATSGSRRRGSPSRSGRTTTRPASGTSPGRGSTRPRCAPRSACRVRSRGSGSCRGATCRRCPEPS